ILLHLFFSAFPGAGMPMHSFPTRRSSDLDGEMTHLAPGSRLTFAIKVQSYGGIAEKHLPFWQPSFRLRVLRKRGPNVAQQIHHRSEEHTSELQSRGHLVCRLLLEKKNDRR